MPSMRLRLRAAFILALTVLGGCSGGGASNTTSSTTSTTSSSSGSSSSSTFALTSTAVAAGGTMPDAYSCDGAGSTLPLAWSGAPSGTTEYAILMTTLPGDGTTKYNWVVHGIPAGVSSLAKDELGIGSVGVGSDGSQNAYAPPCSQGGGLKNYTITIYALSGSPVLPSTASSVTGAVLANAISSLTLGSASLTFGFTRTTQTGSSTACLLVKNSTAPVTTGGPVVTCDATYAYISSTATPQQSMMKGITETNLQVPTPQNFQGSNAWRIPLSPAVASSTTSVAAGPVGVAINGVPIFNACTQTGCTTGSGDTVTLGQVDTCNGHAGRADDYHYHAAPTCLMATESDAHYWDTHPIGWALDGFAIFGFYNADGSTATRDSTCGGNTLSVSNAPSGYSYHTTTVYPYIMSCLVGTPSPDLAGQGSKYSPFRQPPVTPFVNSSMTLTTDSSDGYSVLQFTSAQSFTTTETGSDSYTNASGTYRIRYKQITGDALATLLSSSTGSGKTMCWSFQFLNSSGADSQPATTYCR